MPFLAPAIPAIAGGLGSLLGLSGGAATIANIAGAVGGAALGAVGRSGKQGGQTQTGHAVTTRDLTDTVSQRELPEIGAFRNTLFPAFGQALADAQAPLFSENAQAAFLGRLNDTSNKAIDAITSNLARRGALNSGALGSAFTDVELSRNRDITDFLTQLPILERETRFNQTLPLLNLGLQFAGRGPVETTQRSTGSSTTDQEGNVSVQGPGFLRALAGEGSDLLSLILSGRLSGGNNLPNQSPVGGGGNPLATVLGNPQAGNDSILNAILGLS